MSVDLFPEQPLYAFVEFRVGTDLLSSIDGYLYQNDNGYGDMTYDYGDDNSKMVTGLVVNRNGVMNLEFTISLFDDTAVYAETIITRALQMGDCDIEIEYGWASRGKKITERSYSFKGTFTEYSLAFNGPSTTLEVIGTGNEVQELAQSGTETYDVKVYKGSPSNIVKAIADSHGWSYDDTTIVETQSVQDTTNSGELMTFLQNGRTEQEFINQDLIPNSISLSGDSGYSFWIKDGSDGGKTVYFKPLLTGVEGTYESTVVDGNGGQETSVTSPSIPSFSDLYDKCVRHYDYYSGVSNNEVISFTPSCSSSGEYQMSTSISSIDATGEAVNCRIRGLDVNKTIEGMKMVGSGSSKSRMMGISTATYQGLEIASKFLWNTYAGVYWEADLEIMGDPGLTVGDYVEVNVYTKYGFKHHTSGIYMILEAEDSIESGSFTTTLHLQRSVCNTEDSGTYNGFGEGTTEAPGAQSQTGALTGTVLSANSTLLAGITPQNRYPVPSTSDWIEIALSQKGANESDGTHAKYLLSLGLDADQPWCAAFVSWCLTQAGVTVVTKTASCKTMLSDAVAKGRFGSKLTYTPKAGDIFIQRENGASHVGFVTSVNAMNDTYTTIEGNYSNMVTSVTRKLNDSALSGFYVL